MLPFPAIYQVQRVTLYATKNFVGFVIGGNLLLAGLTILLWPVAVLIRKRYQRPLFTAKTDRVVYFLCRIVCIGELILVLAPLIMFSEGLEHIVVLGHAINRCMEAFRTFGWIVVAGSVPL